MRSILALAFVAALSPVAAFAQSCGIVPITPIKPIGCTGTLQPVCVCSADGQQCFWQFVCVQ